MSSLFIQCHEVRQYQHAEVHHGQIMGDKGFPVSLGEQLYLAFFQSRWWYAWDVEVIKIWLLWVFKGGPFFFPDSVRTNDWCAGESDGTISRI